MQEELKKPFFWFGDKQDCYTDDFNNLMDTCTSKVHTEEELLKLMKKWYGPLATLENAKESIQKINKMRNDYKEYLYTLTGSRDDKELFKLHGEDIDSYLQNAYPYELACSLKY